MCMKIALSAVLADLASLGGPGNSRQTRSVPPFRSRRDPRGPRLPFPRHCFAGILIGSGCSGTAHRTDAVYAQIASDVASDTIFALGLLFTGCADLPQRRLTRVDPPPAKPSTPLQLPAPPTPAVQPAELKTTPQADPGKPPVTQVRAVGESAANPLRALHDHAAQRYQTMDTYIMRLKRREVVGGKARPEELILVKFRQEPWSVYFKWIGPEAKGREVVHVKGQYDNRIHSLVAAGDVLLMHAGQRFSI